MFITEALVAFGKSQPFMFACKRERFSTMSAEGKIGIDILKTN